MMALYHKEKIAISLGKIGANGKLYSLESGILKTE